MKKSHLIILISSSAAVVLILCLVFGVSYSKVTGHLNKAEYQIAYDNADEDDKESVYCESVVAKYFTTAFNAYVYADEDEKLISASYFENEDKVLYIFGYNKTVIYSLVCQNDSGFYLPCATYIEYKDSENYIPLSEMSEDDLKQSDDSERDEIYSVLKSDEKFTLSAGSIRRLNKLYKAGQLSLSGIEIVSK